VGTGTTKDAAVRFGPRRHTVADVERGSWRPRRGLAHLGQDVERDLVGVDGRSQRIRLVEDR
jgi:hypothetical protein